MLTHAELSLLHQRFDYPVAVIQALLEVLGHGAPFYEGAVVRWFEPRLFYRYSRCQVDVQGTTQEAEMAAFQKAVRMYPTYARLSCRWGVGRVLGKDFAELGFDSIEQFEEAFASEYMQVLCWLLRVSQSKQVKLALSAADWRGFVSSYFGGSGYPFLPSLEAAYLARL